VKKKKTIFGCTCHMNTALKRDLTRTSFIDIRVSYRKEIAIPVTFIWDKSV